VFRLRWPDAALSKVWSSAPAMAGGSRWLMMKTELQGPLCLCVLISGERQGSYCNMGCPVLLCNIIPFRLPKKEYDVSGGGSK
jgi:hypothetical protein